MLLAKTFLLCSDVHGATSVGLLVQQICDKMIIRALQIYPSAEMAAILQNGHFLVLGDAWSKWI